MTGDDYDDVASPVLVDVLLPVRDPAPYLDETLDGLTAQTMQAWRLIAVIHGDPSRLSSRISQSVPDAVILNADASASLVDVLNLGLRACTAPYVARIDADDIPEPDRLRAQTHFLEEHPDVAILGTLYRRINESGVLIDTEPLSLFEGRALDTLMWRNIIAHPTVMARTAALRQLGGYRPEATHAEDYELWMRAAALWDVEVLQESLLRYRIHANQVTQTKAIPHRSRRAIGKTRRDLARARGMSKVSAQFRQTVWAAPQWLRMIQRRST